MSTKEIARVLRAIPGLSDAHEDVLSALAEQFTRRVYAQATVGREGEPANSLYVLTAGSLDVHKLDDDGQDRLVAQLTPICLFGNAAVARWSTRPTTVRAPRWAEVLEIPAHRVQELIADWDFTVSSPLRRAIIVATGWQIAQANRTIGRLAIDAGIAEPVNAASTRALVEAASADASTTTEKAVPTDAEQRLLEALARL